MDKETGCNLHRYETKLEDPRGTTKNEKEVTGLKIKKRKGTKNKVSHGIDSIMKSCKEAHVIQEETRVG